MLSPTVPIKKTHIPVWQPSGPSKDWGYAVCAGFTSFLMNPKMPCNSTMCSFCFYGLSIWTNLKAIHNNIKWKYLQKWSKDASVSFHFCNYPYSIVFLHSIYLSSPQSERPPSQFHPTLSITHVSSPKLLLYKYKNTLRARITVVYMTEFGYPIIYTLQSFNPK